MKPREYFKGYQSIGIVAHDAGGASALIRLIENGLSPVCYNLEGPALRIFLQRNPEIEITPLEELVERVDLVLTGTSWESNLELKAIDLGRKNGKETVSLLDHWVNFAERFGPTSQEIYPDKLIVLDAKALGIAIETLEGIPVQLLDCTRWLQRHAMIPRSLRKILYFRLPTHTALFLVDPIEYFTNTINDLDNKFQIPKYEMQSSFEYALQFLEKRHKDISRIIIRPHPSTPETEIDTAVIETKLIIEMSANFELSKDLNIADVVIGCDTMAMVEAVSASKKVYCAIPFGHGDPSIPIEGITMIRDL
jgi:hypothetical protein